MSVLTNFSCTIWLPFIYLVFIELTIFAYPWLICSEGSSISLFPAKFIAGYCRAHTCPMSVDLDFPFDHMEKNLLIHFAIIIAIETGFVIILVFGHYAFHSRPLMSSVKCVFYKVSFPRLGFACHWVKQFAISCTFMYKSFLPGSFRVLDIQVGHGRKHSKLLCIAFQISDGNVSCNAGSLGFVLKDL